MKVEEVVLMINRRKFFILASMPILAISIGIKLTPDNIIDLMEAGFHVDINSDSPFELNGTLRNINYTGEGKCYIYVNDKKSKFSYSLSDWYK